MTGTGSAIDGGAASQRILRPTSIAEALAAVAAPGALLIAGGCEFGLRREIARGDVILLDRIPGLDRLVAHPKIGLTIGATVRMHAIVNQIWIAKRWAALHEAVEQLLPPQIRNMATVVGNVCAARPDYDMACALMALRGSMRAVKTDGKTVSVALDAFYDDAGRIALAAGCIVREIFVPSPDAGSAFRKAAFGATTVSAAASVSLDTGGERIEHATLVIGGCLPAPRHAVEAESFLRGAAAASAAYEEAGRMSTNLLSGVRGDAAQIKLVSVLARDALEQAASRARSKHNPFDDAQHLL